MELEGFWQTLGFLCGVRTNQSCSTYDYVSLEREWTVKDILRLAKAVLWFEPAIQAIIPAHHRDNNIA
jgi:hypothetical protein